MRTAIPLRQSRQLSRFAKLVEGEARKERPAHLWELYSFKDLPVELISHIYQLFVENADSFGLHSAFPRAVMLEEALSWKDSTTS